MKVRDAGKQSPYTSNLTHSERPRRADAVRVDPGEAALVAQLFGWYLEPGATIYRLARRLTDLGVPTPMGGPRWNVASVRGVLRNPAYAGRALSNRTQVAPARRRKSAMLPAGPGQSHAPRPEEDWIAVPVPPIVSEEIFAQVQAKLDANQQCAARNTRHEYLLRALVSCGACRLSCTGRQVAKGYRYYLCRGRTDSLRAAQGQRCTARYIPAAQLDELVWADLCALLADPAQAARALARAQGGAWLPQELQARQAAIGQALAQLERQQQRLLDAYLAEVVTLPELDRKRQDLDRRRDTLLAQQRQLDAAARQRLELGAVADGIEAFCQTVRAGLAAATFEQRRQLAELLIDCVVVTDDQVEIRYVLPTSPDGPHRPFCQLRKDHLDLPSFSIEDGDFPGGVLLVVQQGGQQPDGAGPGAAAAGAGHDGELDQPGDRVREPGRGLVARIAAAPGAHAVRFVQHDQLRAVGQGLQRLDRDGLRAVLDPPAQLRPGGGEPQEPVHGEEAAVGEVERAGCQRGFQLVCQGVLPVVVAADGGGGPPVRSGADQGDEAEHGVLPAGGHPERGVQLVIGVQRGGSAVERGDLHPVPQLPGAQLRAGPGRVQLERPARDLLAGPRPGLRQRRPGRHRGARRDGIQARHGERGAQHLVIALPGEQAPGDQAQQGVLRGQHPVQPVVVRRRRRRLADGPFRQELLQQALAVQALQFLQPQARAGRHPGGQPRPQAARFLLLPGISDGGGAGLRRRHAHGKMAGQI